MQRRFAIRNQRMGLLAVLCLAGALAALEGTTGIDQTHPTFGQGMPITGHLVDATDSEIGDFAIQYVAGRGWVPRGERPKVVSVRRMTPSTLPDSGPRFGPNFFPDPETGLVLVVVQGLFNYRQGSLLEYRPRPPAPGQMALLFDLESGHNVYWGG